MNLTYKLLVVRQELKNQVLGKVSRITQNYMYNCYFSLLIIDIPSDENSFLPRFCPFFGHFRSCGPNITSLATAREVMMVPGTGNALKTCKISAEMNFHSSVMTMISTLKLSVIQLAIVIRSQIFLFSSSDLKLSCFLIVNYIEITLKLH